MNNIMIMTIFNTRNNLKKGSSSNRRRKAEGIGQEGGGWGWGKEEREECVTI
jgi:hypothetical protein